MEAIIDEAAVVERAERDVPPFRLNCKNLFLTYPHCEVDKELAMNMLIEKFGRGNVLYMVVAQEEHQDGDHHLHAAVLLGAKCNIRDVHYLDLMDHHGNYQSTRSMKSTVRYVKKDGGLRRTRYVSTTFDERIGSEGSPSQNPLVQARA